MDCVQGRNNICLVLKINIYSSENYNLLILLAILVINIDNILNLHEPTSLLLFSLCNIQYFHLEENYV